MTFAADITKLPRAMEPDRGQEAADRIGLSAGALRDLVVGAAGSAPYIYDLIRTEADWLADTLLAPPEAVRAQLCADESFETDVMQSLRQAKRRMALYVALADLGGVWDLPTTTSAITAFADHAVSVALQDGLRREVARGFSVPDQQFGGLVAIAMGKMGAFELNYSSDIDLICLFDETLYDPDDYAEVRSSCVRVVKHMSRLLSDRTSDGYVFRTDLRLRPDAAVTPVALAIGAAERYYESVGRTWERAAYIKARPAAGDVAAGARFLEALRPFVWRRYLDFAAIEDAHAIRQQIRDHKGLHGGTTHLGYDIKLGAGGIREIEFFTQTRQLIAGGRDPDLRVSRTVDGLSQLAGKGWIDGDVADILTMDYRAHRNLEHRLQMVADQQTHTTPSTEEEFRRIAYLSGEDPESFAQELRLRIDRVRQMTDAFFEPRRKAAVSQVPDHMSGVIDRWRGFPALRSPRAVEIFQRVLPDLMQLFDASQSGEALGHFEQFLGGLPSGVQLFSMFEANPQLMELVVDVVDTAPALGLYLAQNSAVFDAVIDGAFFSDWPGRKVLRQELTSALAEEGDYERKLDRARVWAREWHFRVGVHHLRGLIDAEQAGQQYADLAAASAAALWPVTVDAFAEKHGPPPGQGAAIVAMGSLGAGRLTAVSDLDLIAIYDGQSLERSDGRRPLDTRTYYARLTQSLVTALSAPTAKGRLYEVDMRLRPSGRQGPVATSLSAFTEYQSKEAWTWEHLALTRACPIAGNGTVGDGVEKVRDAVISAERDRSAILSDVADMRGRLAASKMSEGLDAKVGPGRLMDIELFAQTASLLVGGTERGLTAQLMHAKDAFALSSAEFATLCDAQALFWRVQSAMRLVSGKTASMELGQRAVGFITKDAGSTIEQMQRLLETTAEQVQQIIDRHVGAGDNR